MPKKNILIIVENLPSPMDTRVWLEANALYEQGYGVSIICPKGKGYEQRYENINGINIYRHFLPVEGIGALGYLLEYICALFMEFTLSLKVLFKHGFDVIQACNPPDTIFIIGAFYKLFGKKFIFDHHDINPELYLAKFGRRDFFYNLLLMLERLTYFFADISIATNESYREIAIRRGKMSPEKVFVVRSCPKLSSFELKEQSDNLAQNAGNNKIKENNKYEIGSEDKNTALLVNNDSSTHFIEEMSKNVSNLVQEIDNNDDDLLLVKKLKDQGKAIIGYVGVIGNQEGLDLLVEVSKLIRQKRDDVFYLIIGGGTELEVIKNLVKNACLEDIYKFTGFLPHEKMIKLLSHADILVCPDKYNEMNNKSTMVKIMEYMALGKPIVQFDLLENRYSAGESSLYAEKDNCGDFADKILLLLDNPLLRKEMGKIGRNRIEEEFNWDVSKQNLYKAYNSLFKVK